MFFIKLQFLLFGLVGLAPFTFRDVQEVHGKERKRSVIEFECSWVRGGFNLVIILFILCVGGLYIPGMLQGGAEDKTALSKNLKIALIINGHVGFGLLVLLYFLARRRLVKLSNRIIDMDLAMSRLRGIYQLDSGQNRLLFLFYANVFLCGTLVVVEVLMSGRSLSFCLLTLANNIVLSCFVMQYALVLTVIQKRFKSLNNALLKLEHSNVSMSSEYDGQKMPLSRMLVVEIVALKRAYTILYGMCADVADFYAMGILFVITFFTASIIYSTYVFLLIFFQPNIINPTTSKVISTLLWLLIEIFPISAMAICATKTANEMKRTSDVVYKVLDRHVVSPEIKSELEHFLLQLMHNDFEFTAYCVIPVDSRILRTIFSAVVTYLIIFIQFQLDATSRGRH